MPTMLHMRAFNASHAHKHVFGELYPSSALQLCLVMVFKVLCFLLLAMKAVEGQFLDAHLN